MSGKNINQYSDLGSRGCSVADAELHPSSLIVD